MTPLGELLKLYSFESVYGSEDETAIANWICQWLDEKKITGYQRVGNNIYKLDNVDGPILSAHLDQVETNGKAVKFFMNDDEKIVAFNDKWERTSLGADDKNGVWIILQAIKSFGNSINFIISSGEEEGCIGIKKLESDKVLDTISQQQFCLVLDRRGNKDILKSGGGTTFCSTLAQSLCNYLQQTYEVTTGSLSDTCTISKYCESVNMSVAYDNPHTANEITNFKRLKEISEDVLDVINCFEHYSTPPSIYQPASTTISYYDKWRTYYGENK